MFCDGGASHSPLAPIQKMIAFIDEHRAAHGVERICGLLPIAPSTYHAHVAKRDYPAIGHIAPAEAGERSSAMTSTSAIAA